MLNLVLANKYRVKYVFGLLTFNKFLELVHFKTLDQFSYSYFEIHEFSHFNQILLGLFDFPYALQD